MTVIEYLQMAVDMIWGRGLPADRPNLNAALIAIHEAASLLGVEVE